MKLNIFGKLTIFLTLIMLTNCLKTNDQPDFETQIKTIKKSISDKISEVNLESNPNQNLLKKYLTKNFLSFDIENLKRELLETHNKKRAAHGVEKLTINPKLNQIAQNFADKLAQTNTFHHSGNNFNGQPMGENLFMQYGRQMTGDYCTNSWYNEIKDYNFYNPNASKGVVGHFTQIVWKGSREVGFGCGVSRNGGYFIVANYFPAGNYVGQNDNNVFPLQ